MHVRVELETDVRDAGEACFLLQVIAEEVAMPRKERHRMNGFFDGEHAHEHRAVLAV